MVDIWSLGVVLLQYGYGLLKKAESTRASRSVEIWSNPTGMGRGSERSDRSYLNQELRMDYQDWQSASVSLRKVYCLGYHEIKLMALDVQRLEGRRLVMTVSQ